MGTHILLEDVMLTCVVLLECVNLEANNVYSYVRELSLTCIIV
jgi:hypothetical protein